MNRKLTTLAALVLAATSIAQTPAPKVIKPAAADTTGVNKLDKPTAPAWVEITADPLLTTLQAPAAAKWLQIDDGCDLRPAADGKTAIFAAATTGRYRLVVLPEAGEPIRVAVLVGQPPTPPVPVPPSPVPPPAPPRSELGKKLQAAFDADPGSKADKLKMVAIKAELYRQATLLAADPTVLTTGVLLERIKTAASALGVDGLAAIRQVIATELVAVMPADTPLVAGLRTAAAVVFTKIQNALLEVK